MKIPRDFRFVQTSLETYLSSQVKTRVRRRTLQRGRSRSEAKSSVSTTRRDGSVPEQRRARALLSSWNAHAARKITGARVSSRQEIRQESLQETGGKTLPSSPELSDPDDDDDRASSTHILPSATPPIQSDKYRSGRPG